VPFGFLLVRVRVKLNFKQDSASYFRIFLCIYIYETRIAHESRVKCEVVYIYSPGAWITHGQEPRPWFPPSRESFYTWFLYVRTSNIPTSPCSILMLCPLIFICISTSSTSSWPRPKESASCVLPEHYTITSTRSDATWCLMTFSLGIQIHRLSRCEYACA